MEYKILETTVGDLYYRCTDEKHIYLSTQGDWNDPCLSITYRNEDYGINAHAVLKSTENNKPAFKITKKKSDWEVSINGSGVYRTGKDSSSACIKHFKKVLEETLNAKDFGKALIVAGIEDRLTQQETLKGQEKELQAQLHENAKEIMTLSLEEAKLRHQL